ncbi:concanavalin A-like lectin/glucanase superfamily protein [Stackebrandtia albiflava]|uniref:Concanavalin A-like lectin/glucanase superfamily protein n=1 Tax=Stackebrandtia albiflava TaxID=406432 RepID=A0A562V3V6_9ACTN|nr:LamG domain-containing protein [Stackebrandtia albiflava]TWJ12497.1 concanavalin A-like lectin/glucanase superfamily protein [Stackebrandtia albiflava]
MPSPHAPPPTPRLARRTTGVLTSLLLSAGLVLTPTSAVHADPLERPNPPVISSTDYPECTTESCEAAGGTGVAGTFVLQAMDDDVVAFDHGWSGPPINRVPAVNGTATLELTPPGYGGWSLYARAVDADGNVSSTVYYSFVVDRLSPPVAGWDLESGPHSVPLANIVPNGPALVPGGETGWAADARLIGVDTADLDGAGHFTAGTGVVDTTRSFSVAAWVNLSDKSTDGNVIGVDGENMSALYVGYLAALDRWVLGVPHTDTQRHRWSYAIAPEAVTVGQWTHLTASVDRETDTASLYVNGELSAQTALPEAWAATGEFRVGNALYRGELTAHWNGRLAAVRVYDRALIAEDIVRGRDDNRPLMWPALTGHWNFDNDCCGEAIDLSGWDRWLALHNGTSFDVGHDWSGYGMVFDGVDDYAATAGQVLRTDNSFTLSAWARVDADTDFGVLGIEGAEQSAISVDYDA